MATSEFRGNMPRSVAALDAWTRRRTEAALEPELPIIDPHHHLWDDERGRYLLEEFLAEANGHRIVSSIFMQFRAMYRAGVPAEMAPVGEIEFANGLAAICASGRHGDIRLCEGIVGHAVLLHGDAIAAPLEAMVAAGNGRLKGIRLNTAWDDGAAGHGRSFGPRHALADPNYRRGFAHLGRLGLSYDAWMFYTQLPELADLLRAFPDTTVVLDHCGGVLGIPPHVDRQAVFAVWRDHIRALAAYPNLNVKIGGLGMLYYGWDFHLQPDPPTSETLAAAWRPYVETCIEAFGPDRCMFESNFPVDKQSCGYGALWNAYKRITRSFSADDKRALYHDTASRVYRLNRTA